MSLCGSPWLSMALQMRGRGEKVLNLAQMTQRSALVLVAKKSNRIRTPADLQNRTVSLWAGEFQIQPRAFFKKYGLKVKVIPQSASVNVFLRNGVDTASAMWYNEYHTILNSGINRDELTTFFFHEHGLNFPEDGIYTLEKTSQTDPALCRSFVRASIAGWQYSFDHPEEAVEIILKYMREARIPANRAHQKWMLLRMRDLMVPPDLADAPWTLKEGDFEQVARVLKESGLVPSLPRYESFLGGNSGSGG